MTSKAFSLHTINAAVRTACKAYKGEFVPTLSEQNTYNIKWFRDKVHELGKFSGEELMVMVDPDSSVINAWLSDHGFDISLGPTGGFPDLAIASILKVLTQWAEPGVTDYRFAGAVSYEAFSLLTQKNGIKFTRCPQFYERVVSIPTANGDVVHLMMASEPPQPNDNPFFLLEQVAKIEAYQTPSEEFTPNYTSVVVPKVSLNCQPDVNWLAGAWINNARLAQAVNQVVFKMDEKGVEVKSAAAIGVSGSLSFGHKSYVIDRPFYCWITRLGCSAPYFAAYLDEDCWTKRI